MTPLHSLGQIKARLRSISLTALSVSGGMVLLYILTLLLHSYKSHVLEFTPASVLTGNIWQLVTAGFIENSLIALLCNIITLCITNRFLEPVWGAIEYIKFIIIVNTAAYCVNLVIYIVGYILLRDETFLYYPFCGGQGLVGGLFVGLKQLIPDHVLNQNVSGVRVRHIPLAMFLVDVLLVLLRVTTTRHLTVLMAGLAAAWIYLRYFQIRDSGSRGDFSDALSIASFFPESAQPHVLRYSTAVTDRVEGFLKPKPSAPTTVTTEIRQDAVTERRKQIALQALNERLGGSEEVDWPSSSDSDAEVKTDVEVV